MKLNKEQMEFVNEDKSLVLTACPGSGKTTALAYKFNRLSKIYCRTQGVALLSFTNIASEEIKDKIIEQNTKSSLSYPHYIGTIDSFFDYILRRFGYLLFNGTTPLIFIGVNNIYKKKECYSCVNKEWDGYIDILGNYKLNKEKIKCSTSKYYCFEHFKKNISKGIINQGSVPFFIKLLFEKYPQIPAIIIKRFPVILLDEAQDTSNDQVEILDILLKNGCIINYIGDPDQAIYEWRNADLSTFIKKMNDNSFKQIRYYRNNRSSQLICSATKVFGNNLSKMENYISEAQSKNCKIKPILIKYKDASYDEIVDLFCKLVLENNLELGIKKCAVVHSNKNDEITYKKIVNEDNCFMINYLEGIKLYFEGNRNNAEKILMCALSQMLYGDSVSFFVNDDSNNQTLFVDFIKTIVFKDMPLQDWEKETQDKLLNFIKMHHITPHQSYTFKLKTRIKDVLDYKKRQLKSFFVFGHDDRFKDSTIHGVKGETFDSLLLYTKSRSRINGKMLVGDEINNELSRMAFVAMTRPRYLLAVAVQNDVNYEIKFPKVIWEYIEFN